MMASRQYYGSGFGVVLVRSSSSHSGGFVVVTVILKPISWFLGIRGFGEGLHSLELRVSESGAF